jgi:hypothetical protein
LAPRAARLSQPVPAQSAAAVVSVGVVSVARARCRLTDRRQAPPRLRRTDRG